MVEAVMLVLAAVVPIVLMLTLGAALRRTALRDPAVWRGIEWLSYFVFTPALFVGSIGRSDLRSLDLAPLMISVTVPLVGAALLVLALRRVLRIDGPAVGTMVQGAIRINTYVGLTFAAALHGEPGVAAFAIASAVVVPLVNILSVSTLAHYAGAAGASATRAIRELIRNPLILGCAVGMALSLSGIGVPEAVAPTVDLLASPALVAGTLAAGAAIRFDVRRRDIGDVALASAIKLVAVPWAAAALAAAFGVTGPGLTAIVLITALPTAPSATVLAARMGGDVRLMASITGVQTLLSLVSLPVALHVLAGIG